jgi:hypothetical protein
MISRHLFRGFIWLIVLAASAVVFGQSEDSSGHPTLSVGGGFTRMTGNSAAELNGGGNFQLNGGYFFNSNFGITGNFLFNYGGITQAALDSLNQPYGSAKVYAVTADPTFRLPLGRGFSAYMLAGGGYVRRTLHFHKPVLIGQEGPRMPFMLMPGYATTGSISDNSGGFDAGGGINVPTSSAAVKLFVEARYFKGFTSNTYTTLIPVTFGIRW